MAKGKTRRKKKEEEEEETNFFPKCRWRWIEEDSKVEGLGGRLSFEKSRREDRTEDAFISFIEKVKKRGSIEIERKRDGEKETERRGINTSPLSRYNTVCTEAPLIRRQRERRRRTARP